MRLEQLRPVLEALVHTSSKPLIPYSGVLFAIDSTPILAPGYYMSKDRKTGKLYERREWIRLHMICDVLTGIVASARADSKHVAEKKYFQVLLGETMELGFHVEAISADKNYCTKVNVNWAEDRGVKPYITVKRNAKRSKKNSDPAWDENYERAKSDDAEVKLKFHRRNVIESVNAFIKAKYGGEVLSKSAADKNNEALCKVICANLIVLIRDSRAMRFTPRFEK
jgi:transposase